MRIPVVAGQFYPSNPRTLKKDIKSYFSGITITPDPAITGAVVPHAGYVYSGRTAAHVYAALPNADTFVIIGPNHTGYGSMVSVSSDTWSTPLGDVDADLDLIESLPRRIIDIDESAHQYEHSIEVQLPFLQTLFKDFKIVPICMGLQDEETARDVSDELMDAISETDKKVVVIASSDFTHYKPAAVAYDIDHYVLDPLLELNVTEFYSRIRERDASVCGHGPIAVMMRVCRGLGANSARLLNYSNSGDVQPMAEVVGYAGVVVG
ncbi:MAG: MEMO1 family protein [ANME-2 cluster archaeon]|jgi:AmmeMemoRadiSam system protein B|nr:MAG: MEMO1 family protein [ANME-2 cluster archaeon]